MRIGTCTEVGEDVPNWPDVPGSEQDGVHSWYNIFQPKKGRGLLRKCVLQNRSNIIAMDHWDSSTVDPGARKSGSRKANMAWGPKNEYYASRFFCLFFWRARKCWPLLCLCRPFCIYERWLDPNPESFRSKQARYQLSHPSPSTSPPVPLNLATHLFQTSHPFPSLFEEVWIFSGGLNGLLELGCIN
jgi:hypothetical protein